MKMVLGLGQSIQATAGPTMPANVATASTAMNVQPYAGLIVSMGPIPGANVSGPASANVVTVTPAVVANMVATYNALPTTVQSQQLQQLFGLWSFLPSFISNAAIVDAWQNANVAPGPDDVGMGQAVQSLLQQFFAAIGVTPPVQSGSGAASTLPWPLILIGAGILVLVMEVD